MAKEIWKYKLPNPLHDGCSRSYEIPDGAVVLSVAEQDSDMQMWVMVDPEKPLVQRRVDVYGTGMPLSDMQRRFIGTVVLRSYVWHVFEVFSR